MRITVDTIVREQNSRDGNPRWRILTTDDRVYRTARDNPASAFKITGQEAPGTVVDVELDQRGEIVSWSPS